jgi:hypothetical protein
MRDAMPRIPSRGLGAALIACPCHAHCSAACHLQQPTWNSHPAHNAACPWPSFSAPELPPTPNSLRRHSQPSPNPSQSSQLRLCTPHAPHDGGSARAGRTLGSACLAKMVKSAWVGDVRWVCSRAVWTGTPPHPPPPGSQAACPSCPVMERTHATPHRCTASTLHSTTEGHLGVYLLSEGGRLSRMSCGRVMTPQLWPGAGRPARQ